MILLEDKINWNYIYQQQVYNDRIGPKKHACMRSTKMGSNNCQHIDG